MVTEVLLATTTNITLSGATAIQGVTPTAGVSVVLVAGQTDGAQNGPWVVQSGAWTRHPDHDTSAEFVRPWEIFVQQGDYANWRFQFTNTAPPTLGTSVLNFSPVQRDTVLMAGGSLSIDEAVNTIGLSDNGVVPKQWGFASPVVDADGRISYNVGTPGTEAYIIGLKLTYFSATQVQIEIGACYDFSSGKILWRGHALQQGLGAKPISDFMYVYTHDAGDGDAIHTVSTTAPVNSGITPPDAGYMMSGNNTERYTGALRMDASGNPYKFKIDPHSGNAHFIEYLENLYAAPFQVVNGGAATTAQTVNLGSGGLKLVPATATHAYLGVLVNGTASALFGNSEDNVGALTTTSALRKVTFAQRGDFFLLPLDSNQSFRWQNHVTGGSTEVMLCGYMDHR